jgi:hypothetical protein
MPAKPPPTPLGETTQDACDRILAGDWDDQLDQLERAVRARKRDHRPPERGGFPRTAAWAGNVPVEPARRILAGYYDDMGFGPDLIHAAIQNRTAHLRNAQTEETINRLKREAPKGLRPDEAVTLRLDAPMAEQTLRGKNAVVVRQLQTWTIVKFDEEQPLGRKVKPSRPVKVPTWALERRLDPAKIAFVTHSITSSERADSRLAGTVVRDDTGRVRVRHGARMGWAQLGPIEWDDQQ